MTFIACHKDNYTPGRTSNIDHVVMHYTGNNGDTAEGNCKYFQSGSRQASAHYFVDAQAVYQSVKDGDTAWHAGTWAMNCRAIGVELCSRQDGNGKYYFAPQTVNNAVSLVRDIMTKHNVPISNVIRHYDVTGKRCPAPFIDNPEAWQNFKARLTEPKQEESTMTKEKSQPSAWAQDAAKWAVEQGLIQGDENGDCKWQDALTREQFAVILKRFVERK